ncbi:MAG: glycine cleavage system protein H, partial [Pseudomonadota bacterium]|nr:glycine cleavage system protein H [Pseudomonadota bacterium]
MYDIPSNLKYTNAHIWVENIGKNNFRIGITDFAQDELGDIVFV